MSRNKTRSSSSVPVMVGLVFWLGIALFIGAAGLLARAPVPPPAIAFGLTALLLLLLWLLPSLRERVRQVGAGPLVAFHLIRLAAGIYFLVLYGRGVLPRAFAVPAGWGDILVGLAALVVLWLCVPVRTSSQRLGLLLWNVVGLLDILMVLFNGVRLFLRDPGLAVPFTVLPLALLPTFVVPIILVTHVMLFAWAGRSKKASV